MAEQDARHPQARSAARVRSLVLTAVVLLGGIGAVLYGTGFGGKEGPAICPEGARAAAKVDPFVHGQVAALDLGKPPRMAPDLIFNGPDGAPTSLAAFRGRTVLVNFWATWCVPCRTEMPALDRLQAKLGGPDFAVVAVNVDTARLDRPKAFLHDAGIASLPFYADPSANVLQTLKNEGALIGLPTTLLVDKSGCALGVMAGPADWSSDEAAKLIEAAKG